MGPLVTVRRHRSSPEGRLGEELARVVEGEVRFSKTDRALYATDGSNYRQPPIGVVVPKTLEDVVRAMAVCRRFDVPVFSRGGGTSLAGQCCNEGVVFDFSKYLRGVERVDRDAKLATVLPGTVLDELNDHTKPLGLVFGPDPSTHDHCTLGGMIGNNSCGVHAVQSEFYGPGPRTEDQVHTLEVLTYDGVRMTVGPTSDEEYARIVARGGREAEIYRGMRRIVETYGALIRERFPDIPRRVSGYSLPALLPEHGFHVARALVGSESTLVTVLRATVKLTPHFPHAAMLVLGFPDACASGAFVPEVRALDPKPTGIEGIDRKLIEFVKTKHMASGRLADLPEGNGWLIVEIVGDTPEEAAENAEAARKQLTGARRWPTGHVITDPEEQAEVWRLRKSGLGATAYVPGRPDSWPGWEDSAVPPERVGDYLRDLYALFDEYGYDASVYGHFGQGCIHCRIPFDLQSEPGIAAYRSFTRRAAELVVGYGGSLSGEHGDGQARGELLPIMFGEPLMEAMRELKRLWDPDGKMNPGKLIDADPRDAHLRLGADYDPWEPKTELAFTEEYERKFSRAALRCVGVGECRRDGGGTMCPSYMVTHEEMHSTRGRSRLLFEMVSGELRDEGWKSEGVKEALDLCLACKGCKRDCPVDVDMALYKAEFLAHYYEGKLRPRHAYAFGLIDRWARLARVAPGLLNWISHAPGLSWAFKKAGGVAQAREVPKFAKTTFRQWFEARPKPAVKEGAPRVLLWPDTFNDNFFPRTLAAAVEVLEHAGVEVAIPKKVLCCGRPLYDYGMLARARRYWAEILEALDAEIAAGTPVVGVEPSCVAAFRDELTQTFPDETRAKQLAAQTKTLGEYLGSLDGWDPPKLERAALWHAHCHHRAVMGTDPEERILARMGLELEKPSSGCCGMAGAFGFEADHYDVSVACGERVLLPKVRERAEDDLIIADGFSCREQIEQRTDRQALHLAEVIQLALHPSELGRETPERQVHRLRSPELQPAGAPIGKAAAALFGVAAAGTAAYWWLVPLLGD